MKNTKKYLKKMYQARWAISIKCTIYMKYMKSYHLKTIL